MSEILWRPKPQDVDQSSILRLQKFVGSENFTQLHKWSIDNLDQFWSYLWDESQIIGIKGGKSYEEGLDFKSAKFFPDAYLNVVENLLTNNFIDEIAVVSLNEAGERVEITWQQLRVKVAQTRSALIVLGLKPGDHVVAWTPNILQTLIYALAALSIGAVVSTASTDFAPAAVIDRFGQISPKVLLATRWSQYQGKRFDGKDQIGQIVAGLSTLQKVVITDEKFGGYQNFEDWIAPYPGNNIDYVRFKFDHPGFILFSSGTTGKPKCIIHSAAGVLLKLRGEQIFNFDLSYRDKMFFYTTTGWMMWNWLIYVLGSGATILLYNGSPTFPKVDGLITIADNENCTHLGLSARYIDLLSKSDISSKDRFKLTKLKSIISTGSVLSVEGFKYIYSQIKRDIHLASISGGTDICGCFVSANPTVVVIAGEIQSACLGMAVDVFDETGESLPAGQKGELVCTKPFPSMPLGFWKDENSKIYQTSYFEKFNNIWTHGDFAAKSESGGFVIYGRSDATLNARGIRIGTAEIYRVLEQISDVIESLAVAKEVENDSKVVLFVVLRPGVILNEHLKSEISTQLRTNATPKHVPDLILQAPELPKTKSNKLVEIAVGDLINGRKVRNQDALINPESLAWFGNLDLNSLLY